MLFQKLSGPVFNAEVIFLEKDAFQKDVKNESIGFKRKPKGKE